MKPAMYIFLNRGLDMSPGKIAAQAGHAALEAGLISNPDTARSIRISHEDQKALWDAWRIGLHYAKYVMEARDNDHIKSIQAYLEARGFRTVMIYDEGHTEIDPIQPTALGVALVDKEDPHTEASFSSFKLYRDKRPSQWPKSLDWRGHLKAAAKDFDREFRHGRKKRRG